MAQDDPQNKKTSEEESLARLERQVDRGSLFTHTALSQSADRIHEAESFLYGLLDVLIEKKMVTQDEVIQATRKVRHEMAEKGQTLGPGIALRIDGDDDKKDDFVPVNCAERLPICKAVCCSLSFALTAEEVESGEIKWDLGEPYYIRQESTGCCTHLDPNKGCSIYENRPGVCRQYSCANDERIWNDFDKMILNEAWINEHRGASRPRLVTAQMLPQKISHRDVDRHSEAASEKSHEWPT